MARLLLALDEVSLAFVAEAAGLSIMRGEVRRHGQCMAESQWHLPFAPIRVATSWPKSG